MSSPDRPAPRPSDWRALAGLSEELAGMTSLAAQGERIAAVAGGLVPGKPQVWLRESLFRLPDWDETSLYPAEPRLKGMKQALADGETYLQTSSRAKGASRGACVAVPIVEQGISMGVLQIGRPKGPSFKPEEVETLQGVAGVAAVALLASHRVAVERWRIGQLNLVRAVSAQIANVLDLNELARRVTAVIQKTFNYYYVAIFTVEPGQKSLRFRSGAARRGKRRKSSQPLEVEFGQGLIGAVAESGEEIVCDDVRAEPRFRFVDILPETLSEVVLPLKIEDRVLGVLDVQSDQLNAFHPYDLLVLHALADNIAIAVEGARLYTSLRRRADQLTVMAEVSNRVTSSLDLATLMQDVASLVRERFGYPYVHLFTVHNNRRQVIYEAGSGNGTEVFVGEVLDLDAPKGIVPWVAREGKAVLSDDVSQDPRYVPNPLSPETTVSELVVPLIFDGQVLGVIDIESDQQGAFTEDEQLLFEALADSIAAAIHNADLFSSEQWRRQVADSLREVAGLLSANVSVEQVLDTILTELERNLPSDIAALWLLSGDQLVLAAVHGCDGNALELVRAEDPRASLWLANALLADEPLIRRPGEPAGPSALVGEYDDTHSAIAAPLRIGETPVGVLTLTHSTAGRYGHEAQAMTSTFASYAAVAIENARLYDAAQEQAYASAALLQVAQAVVSQNDLDEILGTIIRIMPILVGIQRSIIYLWDDSAQAFIPIKAYGLDDAARMHLWRDQNLPGDFPLLDATRETGKMLIHPLELTDAPGDWVGFNGSWEYEEGLSVQFRDRLLLSVPLVIKNDLYGLMLVEEVPGGLRFRSRRLEIINGISQQLALAIQNDRLQREMVLRERLETEVQLARQIQQTFIPDILPEHDGWDLAARWRTARQVGGDFYDVFQLPNGRLGLFIADVADKGVPAALFMALTRTLVRAAVLENGSPAGALARVNELLLPDTRQGMFVTCAYAVLEPSTGHLTYANAGHNPPLWLKSGSGKVERLVRTGMALGAAGQDQGFHIEDQTIRLSPEDVLLLYTDGLTEAFSPAGDLFEETRLLEVMSGLSAVSAVEVLDLVEAAINDFMGALPPSDDLTMLAVRRLP